MLLIDVSSPDLFWTPMVKRLSCLPSKQAAGVRLPFGVRFRVCLRFRCRCLFYQVGAMTFPSTLAVIEKYLVSPRCHIMTFLVGTTNQFMRYSIYYKHLEPFAIRRTSPRRL